MKYMGSKNRIAKYILPIMLKDRKEGQWWVEPMVGGANMIDKVNGNRLGADGNPSVIKALKFVRDCVTPKSNESYNSDDYKSAANKSRCGHDIDGLDSYALIAFSFGAKWIGGWSRGKTNKGGDRDYVNEQHKASEKQKPLLQGVKLIHSKYEDLEIPPQSIIYCDPPYEGTTGYKDAFPHAEFWDKCREWVRQGHQVFVSEYNAPSDFVCVWQKELNVNIAKNSKGKKGIEKLFVHESQAGNSL